MIGGFNEHSAEVHCFVERAAEAGAVKLAQKAGLGYEDARAELRTRFRRRLSVGGWRDFYAHLCARIPYINPSPAAEAKLLAQRREVDYRWAQKRAAVHQRRLGEGEALAHRAGSGRGMAMNSGNFEEGGAAATQAACPGTLLRSIGAGKFSCAPAGIRTRTLAGQRRSSPCSCRARRTSNPAPRHARTPYWAAPSTMPISF